MRHPLSRGPGDDHTSKPVVLFVFRTYRTCPMEESDWPRLPTAFHEQVLCHGFQPASSPHHLGHISLGAPRCLLALEALINSDRVTRGLSVTFRPYYINSSRDKLYGPLLKAISSLVRLRTRQTFEEVAKGPLYKRLQYKQVTMTCQKASIV